MRPCTPSTPWLMARTFLLCTYHLDPASTMRHVIGWPLAITPAMLHIYTYPHLLLLATESILLNTYYHYSKHLYGHCNIEVVHEHLRC